VGEGAAGSEAGVEVEDAAGDDAAGAGEEAGAAAAVDVWIADEAGAGAGVLGTEGLTIVARVVGAGAALETGAAELGAGAAELGAGAAELEAGAAASELAGAAGAAGAAAPATSLATGGPGIGYEEKAL